MGKCNESASRVAMKVLASLAAGCGGLAPLISRDRGWWVMRPGCQDTSSLPRGLTPPFTSTESQRPGQTCKPIFTVFLRHCYLRSSEIFNDSQFEGANPWAKNHLLKTAWIFRCLNSSSINYKTKISSRLEFEVLIKTARWFSWSRKYLFRNPFLVLHCALWKENKLWMHAYY